MSILKKHWIAVACVAMMAGAAGAQKQRYSESHKPDLLDYPLLVHVTHARVTGAGTAGVLHLDALVDGKHVELETPASGLLHVGDYRARIVAQDEKKSGWFSRSYELLFSDSTHVVFIEVAESD